MAKSNFIVRGGADFSNLYNSFNTAQKKMTAFQTGISKTMKGIGIALSGLAIGKLVKDSVKSAMTVESSINQIERIMGENSMMFNKWAQTQAKAFGMAREEAYKYGATYSNLISTFSSGTKETEQRTTELLKASAVVASATGRTMEDTMERIRSGLLGNTESIEDLGINVNVAMLQSTKAFKQFANGKSWQQLTFQEQQQIRLMSILEQANTKYGNSLAGTTATKQMLFLATLKNIRLNLGQAFLPIYNVILPALTSLASKIEYVTGVFAQFSQALFGKASMPKQQSKQAQAQSVAVRDLGDATEKAGKQAKGALAGFDEINQLDLSAGTEGESVAGGGTVAENGLAQVDDGTGGMMEGVSSKAAEMAEKLKAAFDNMRNAIMSNKDLILSAVAGIIAAFVSFEIIKNWAKTADAVSKAFLALSTAISGISVPILAISALIGIFVANLVYLWRTNEEFRNSVTQVWQQIKTILTTIIVGMWNEIKMVWDTYGATLINNLRGFMASIQSIIYTVWNVILKPIITNALNMLSWLWDNHLKGVVGQIGTFIMQLTNGALEIWNQFISPIVNWLTIVFGPRFVATINYIVDNFGTFLAVIADVTKGLLKTLGGIIDFIVGVFTGNWGKAWNGVLNVFKGIAEMISGIFKGVLNATIDVINLAIQRVMGSINGMIQGAISLINKVPGVDIKLSPINVPKIPKLANGGITNGPTLAMIGDNPGGREVVSPLDDLTNMIASAVGSAVMGAMQFGGNNGGNNEIVMNLEGIKFARVILPKINDEAIRMGYKSILQTT